MTTPDLRAAAERICQIKGEVQSNINGDWDIDREEALMDEAAHLGHKLAIAYLASLPADGDVEIDRDWVQKVLGTWGNLSETLCVRYCRADGWGLYARANDTTIEDDTRLATLRTRSDLRGLCKRLGVGLKDA